MVNPPAEEPVQEQAKIGSKRYLVDQIVRITEAAGVPLKDSCRDMMRMKKDKLQELVTEYVAEAQRKEMADRLGAQSSCDNVIAVAMVRMLHDTAMVMVEKGGGRDGPPLRVHPPGLRVQDEGGADERAAERRAAGADRGQRRHPAVDHQPGRPALPDLHAGAGVHGAPG